MSTQNTSCHVLIADDDEMLAQLLEHMLKIAGFRVTWIANGEDALTQIRLLHPDLVVLDGMMPGMDGFEVLRHLRQAPETSELPVILLTARGMARDVVSGFDLGADDYVVKPFMPEELLARIKKVTKARCQGKS